MPPVKDELSHCTVIQRLGEDGGTCFGVFKFLNKFDNVDREKVFDMQIDAEAQ